MYVFDEAYRSAIRHVGLRSDMLVSNGSPMALRWDSDMFMNFYICRVPDWEQYIVTFIQILNLYYEISHKIH